MPTLPNQLDLIVDTAGGKLLRGFESTKEADPPKFAFGDTIPVTVRLVGPNSSNEPSRPWRDLSLTNLQTVLSVGDLGAAPSAGTWQITWASNTTINLAYDASASNVQSSLNSLVAFQNAGNVTVLRPSAGTYRVVWNANGAQANLSVDADTLYPTTTAEVYEAIAGSGSQREAQLIRLRPDPAAQVTLSDNLDAAAVSISVLRHGNATTYAKELVEIDLSDPEPYGGTYALTIPDGATSNTTTALDWDSTATALQTAIIATNSTALTSKVTVTGEFPTYTVEFNSSLGNLAAITSDTSGLDVPAGFKGNLDTNVATFLEHLNGRSQYAGKVQIRITNTVASTSWTPLLAPAVLTDQLDP